MKPHTANSLLAAVAKDYIPLERAALARNQGAIQTAQLAAELLEVVTASPRHIYEWATGREWADLKAARDRNEALGEAASCDLLEGYRNIAQMMDWCATHMALNMGVCFRCSEGYGVVGLYAGFPLCERCMKDMEKAREPNIEKESKRAYDIIKAVFAQVPISPKSHREVCKEPKKRHSYYISTPTGFVRFDHSTTPHRGDAQMWTKTELETVKAIFADIGSPLEIFRVVK